MRAAAFDGIAEITNPLVAKAFRALGTAIEQRSHDLSDNLTGFLKLQMLSRSNPELVAKADKLVGNGAVLAKPGEFERIKQELEAP